jgi:glutamate dehydrogenase
MLTHDSKKRAQIISQTLEIINQNKPLVGNELLLSLAPIVLAEIPDRILFKLKIDELADQVIGHFHFIVQEIPPSIQLFKGPPGIHVSVYSPNDSEARTFGGGYGLPIESTLIRIHTLDAPFLFESLKNYFSKAGLSIFFAIHPVFSVQRHWERISWIGESQEEGMKESYCFFQIEPIDSKETLRRMQHEIGAVLKSVFMAVDDFDAMLQQTRDICHRLANDFPKNRAKESAHDFLEWLMDENYVFLGIARYELSKAGLPCRIDDRSTGVFKDPELLPIVFPGFMNEVESRIVPLPGDSSIVHLDYSNNASAIHHLEQMDFIILREWNAQGDFCGASLLLGRFSRSAFVQRTQRIPILREKMEWILKACNADPHSHIYRELTAAFNRMPMRELFYAPAETLKAILEPIAFMLGDEEIFVQYRNGTSYVVLSVTFSRLRYSHYIQEKIQRALSVAFGRISFHTSANCGSASLILFYFDQNFLNHPINEDAVLEIVTPLIKTWEDQTAAALKEVFGEREGRRLFKNYVTLETRSGLYREVTPPAMVPEDVRHLNNLEERIEVRLIPISGETGRLQLYSLHPLGFTETLNTLGNLGLEITDEMRIPLLLPDKRNCYLYRYDFNTNETQFAKLIAGEERFVEALRMLDEEHATDDPLNALIIAAGLTWRQVEMLRTFRNHLLQIRPHYSGETINRALLSNSIVASALIYCFEARFNPSFSDNRTETIGISENKVRISLESVPGLAEHEILRALFNLIQSSLRTNFYQIPERLIFSIKVDSEKVEAMPSPKPLFEIYVHSNQLEGIHLRGGKVARGGIRWSDRHDDFRTEILGLMQTQMLKNSIIVPVGSKGGFVLKGRLPEPPALDAWLTDRYREYISSLLDITDNIVDGSIMHPPEVFRFDGDDPYFVVAADKGTAHLSNTANEISFQYGFWLGDAFASGGDTGYDHKKIGITARGAWECIKHHFHSLGINIQKEPLTVCGIGDLAGDVFGNGMLQSKTIRLIAAFNHQHIFIDPNPDPELSYRERERMFGLARSTWKDYDFTAISNGGGIFDRTSRSIQITPQMRSALKIEEDIASGEDLIRHILKAPVDLLYNGGIGTYIKSSSETDAEVGDHANDRVRINGCELRARVVGEGGNLGFTHKGRIEYWMKGGLINTDALDNSGGVDASDHEVNLKILLDLLVRKKIISTKEQRNRLLQEMTEEVAALVLADNINQSRALTLDGLRSAARYGEFVDLIDILKDAQVLSSSNPRIPSISELRQSNQQDRGLPRPLLADLLCHVKMWGYNKILHSNLPDKDIAHPFLDAYFPLSMRKDFHQYFDSHPLRREIIATGIINYLINNGGIGLPYRLQASSKAELPELILTYLETDLQINAPAQRKRVLAGNLAFQEEHKALEQIENAIESAMLKTFGAINN